MNAAPRRQMLGAAASGVALGLITVGAFAATGLLDDSGSSTGSTVVGSTPVPAAESAKLAGSQFRSFTGELLDLTTATDQAAVTVVNFWSADCPPCVEELPSLAALHDRFDGDVRFVGITNDVDQPSASELAARSGVTYPLGADPTGDMFSDLGLLALPSTVLVGDDNTVLDIITGPVDEDGLSDRIEQALTTERALSGERSPSSKREQSIERAPKETRLPVDS